MLPVTNSPALLSLAAAGYKPSPWQLRYHTTDTDWVLAHYADDMKMWTAGSLAISGTRTKPEIRTLMDGVLGAFPEGLFFRVRSLTAEEDRVAIEAGESPDPGSPHRLLHRGRGPAVH